MQEQREQVVQTALEDEMKHSYLDYAMSVIIGRALPDVRDGLKPVHRRIIYAMRELGLMHNRPHSKCAKIVGETMGKFHPHGEAAIYDTLVRMAQDFSMRYPLIDGQGNFGSVDGDPPAAMRYTEARLAELAEYLLLDIDKETVRFTPNYDGKELEPDVLPCAVPNLLVNGSSGIAVGMATNIPPHNLAETIDALVVLIDNPQIELKDIMNIMPGPDFPTGGFIVGRTGILDAYESGRGIITIRSRIRTEQLKGGKEAIIISEIPFQINKTKLIEDIADLVRQKKIQALSDIRDESDRDGMRIVLELKKGEMAQVVINQLFKHTKLQDTFGIIMLALVDGKPRYLPLLRMLGLYLDHRREVIIRRTRFDLQKAEKRLHIVEGLKIAVDNIDAVIKLIRSSSTVEEAKEGLMKRFKLSSEQAQAILDMRLQRLTGLERQKLEEERESLVKTIKELREILDSPRKVDVVLKKELLEAKEKFGDRRHTEIIDEVREFTIEDLIAEERMVITVSHAGYIKRTPTALYRRQRRGGKGSAGMDTKEEDWVERVFIGTTHNYILFFTDKGKAYWLKVYALPQAGRASRGRPIVNLLSLDEGENVKAMIPVSRFDDQHFLVMATKKGLVVKNSLALYSNPRSTGIKAINVADDDELVDVKLTSGQETIFIGTRKGKAICFHETDVRPTGRFTGGVRGIRLAKGDKVIGMESCQPNTTILTVCERGFGKRTAIEEYPVQHRGGKGVINIKTTERNGNVISIREVIDDDELILITQKGMTIRTPVGSIRAISRNTQGVRLINLESGDTLTSVARLGEKEEEAGESVSEGEEAAESNQEEPEQSE
jgi:DNA gyrase subunit A